MCELRQNQILQGRGDKFTGGQGASSEDHSAGHLGVAGFLEKGRDGSFNLAGELTVRQSPLHHLAPMFNDMHDTGSTVQVQVTTGTLDMI